MLDFIKLNLNLNSLRLIMNCLIPTFSLFFGSISEFLYPETLKEMDYVIAYEGEEMNIVVPQCPLASGSLKIQSKSTSRTFSEWKETEKKESYALMQDVIQIFEKKGIKDYLIYGKESNPSKSTFSFEIVPYPTEGLTFLKQFKVLWNITFGSSCLPFVKLSKIAKNFEEDQHSFSKTQHDQIEVIKKAVKGSDAFCNPKIIEKQMVFEGKEINVLYSNAPLAIDDEKLHFLVVPKEHRHKFSDLTRGEYLEAMDLAQKLIGHYKKKGYHTAFIFDKSGEEAGQTQAHWHEHIIFTATKTQEFWGQLTVLKNMTIGSSSLPDKELNTRVNSLKQELNHALNK